MTAATKVDVEREMLNAWETLGSAVDSFSDEELELPGVVDGWTVKDLLGHIAFWADKAAEDLALIAQGNAKDVEVPGGEKMVDEWNARERKAREGKSLVDVREEWLASFDRAMEALAAFPAERLEENVKGLTVLARFAGDTYEHYREHVEHLNAWRRELETTET